MRAAQTLPELRIYSWGASPLIIPRPMKLLPKLLILVISCSLALAQHSHSHGSSDEEEAACSTIQFQCSMPEAPSVFQAKAGCHSGTCESLISRSDSNFSNVILEHFHESETHDDHHSHTHRSNSASRPSRHVRSVSACSDCAEISLDSISWSATGSPNTESTEIQISVTATHDVIEDFKAEFNERVESLNSHLQAAHFSACRNWTLNPCCESEGTMDIRIAFVFVILFSSSAGVVVPFLFSSCGQGDIFYVLRAFSGGIILALAFTHLMPATVGLNEKTTYGSLNGVFFLVGIVLSCLWERIGEELLGGHHFDHGHHPQRSSQKSASLEADISEGALQSNGADQAAPHVITLKYLQPSAQDLSDQISDGTLPLKTSLKLDAQKVITAHSVELGIVVHTIILGITAGMWTEKRIALIGFMIAMIFHQFFEGVCLSSCMLAASDSISTCRKMWLATIFSLSFPLSICLGIGLTYAAVDDKAREWASAVLNATSGGILVYMGLISLIAQDFLLSEYVMMPEKRVLRMIMVLAMTMGMAVMCILAIWG
jgi:solute carrier family 39 (zinc transporter), member 1/2/3